MPLTTRAQARRYVARTAKAMGLADWTIVVSADDPPENAIGAMDAAPGRKLAHVYFSEGFYDDTPEEQRNTVCHELVHVHHAHPDHVAWECLDRSDRAAWRLAMEYAVDGVATAWAQTLPLPK